jgi:hypothetical protein
MLSLLFWRKVKDKGKTAQVKFDASGVHSFLANDSMYGPCTFDTN